MTSDLLRGRQITTAVLLGTYGCAIALVPATPSKLLLAAPLLLIPLMWWTAGSPNRWLLGFIAAAWLLPPLPFHLGSAGPHPAILLAAIGVFAGLLTCLQWRIRIDLLSGSLLLLFATLLVSCLAALAYSGAEIAAAALTRVLLFGISVYSFVYVRDGPFELGNKGRTTLIRVIFWAAVGSAVLACLDFYFQFSTAPGHSVQYIWLDADVYRRAQGVFYEASTLGSLCVFVITLAMAAFLQPAFVVLPKWALLTGTVPLVIALVMSYSRGSLVSLGVAIVCLLAMKGRWSQWKRGIGVAITALALSGIGAVFLSPALARAAWMRIAASMEYFSTAPNAVLSGRLSTWTTLANFIFDEPGRMLFGVGFKTLSLTGVSGTPLIADNAYLSAFIETGVIGFVALIALNVMILVRGYRAARSVDTNRSFLGMWIFSFWMGETVQMLSGDLLTYWRVLPVFFCIAALADREVP